MFPVKLPCSPRALVKSPVAARQEQIGLLHESSEARHWRILRFLDFGGKNDADFIVMQSALVDRIGQTSIISMEIVHFHIPEVYQR